jgi:hypothetical protein
MLSLIIVFAVAIPLMIWALSPSPAPKHRPTHIVHPPADLMSMPPSAGASDFHFGSSCDAGHGGGCDGGAG